ncbi:hypothetical protein LCGC14_2023550, partial [marine sediment metagenome]
MTPNINFAPLGPELIITSVAIIVLMLDITLKNKYRNLISWISVAGLVAALVYAIIYFGVENSLIVSQLSIDHLSVYARLGILLVAIMVSPNRIGQSAAVWSGTPIALTSIGIDLNCFSSFIFLISFYININLACN